MTEQETRAKLAAWRNPEMTAEQFEVWVARVHRGKTDSLPILQERLQASHGVYPVLTLPHVTYAVRHPTGRVEQTSAEEAGLQLKAPATLGEAIERLSQDGRVDQVRTILNQVLQTIKEELWAHGVFDRTFSLTVNWGVEGLETPTPHVRLFDIGELTTSKQEALESLQSHRFEMGWEILGDHWQSIETLSNREMAEWFLQRVRQELTPAELERIWDTKRQPPGPAAPPEARPEPPGPMVANLDRFNADEKKWLSQQGFDPETLRPRRGTFITGGPETGGGGSRTPPDFAKWLRRNGLAEYEALKPLFTPAIQAVLLEDPALRPVFLWVLPDEAVGPLEAVDAETIDALGGPSLLNQHTVFLAGSAETANQLLLSHPNFTLIVGVTDRSSELTLNPAFTVANNRTVYFPLPDGTWLGVKGAGQFGDDSERPQYWNTDAHRYEGLTELIEGIRAAEARAGNITRSANRWVQFLGYRKLYLAPIKDDRFESLRGRLPHPDDINGTLIFEPILLFTRVREPHRLTKFPQLLDTDPGLRRLTRRVSKTLARLGELRDSDVLTPSEFMLMMMRNLGASEADKQNAQRFKATINEQDFTFAGEEADVGELIPYMDYQLLLEQRRARRSSTTLVSKYRLDVVGLFAKTMTLADMLDIAEREGQINTLFPKRLETLQALWESYFARLEDRYLSLWVSGEEELRALLLDAGVHVPKLELFPSGVITTTRLRREGVMQRIFSWAEAEARKRREKPHTGTPRTQDSIQSTPPTAPPTPGPATEPGNPATLGKRGSPGAKGGGAVPTTEQIGDATHTNERDRRNP